MEKDYIGIFARDKSVSTNFGCLIQTIYRMYCLSETCSSQSVLQQIIVYKLVLLLSLYYYRKYNAFKFFTQHDEKMENNFSLMRNHLPYIGAITFQERLQTQWYMIVSDMEVIHNFKLSKAGYLMYWKSKYQIKACSIE